MYILKHKQKRSEILKKIGQVCQDDKQRILRQALKDLRQKKDPEKWLDKQINQAKIRFQERKQKVPAPCYNQNLPIFQHREELLQALRENQVLIVAGETGSGKTTQMPRFCLEAGLGVKGKIGLSQPRRIAAISISERIAEEMGDVDAHFTGCKVRFYEKKAACEFIKVMTDGMLLAESAQDPYLNEYECLIIDEAHERSLNIDLLLGLIKKLLQKRKDLKLIVTSATIDTKKFSAYFDKAPVIEVSGRLFPVECHYQALEEKDEEPDYITEAVKLCRELAKNSRSCDILIFMPTQADILECCGQLQFLESQGTAVYPLYASLPRKEQQQIFHHKEGRKIVVATNIAETSLTIPNVRYVIDSGLARISGYSSATRTTLLPVKSISRASADQRMGRCGRVRDGVCYRLFSEEDYLSRPEYTPPEILRSNLASVALQMTVLGIPKIEDFPFIDRPSEANLRDAVKQLEELDAAYKKDSGQLALTKMGRKMARVPLDPALSRMIFQAQKEGCLLPVLIICSFLESRDPRLRPPGEEQKADQAHKTFLNQYSDFLSFLEIWKGCIKIRKEKSERQLKKYCQTHYLGYRTIREVRDIFYQLQRELKSCEINIKEEEFTVPKDLKDPWYQKIHRSLLAGLISNIACLKEKNFYLAAHNKEVMLFPGSALFNQQAPWVMAEEMILTGRLYARVLARIEGEWAEESAGPLCRYSYTNPYWDKKKGAVMALEQVSLFGLRIVRDRPRPYGKYKPDEASRIFIQSALVEEQMELDYRFLRANAKLKQEIIELENKLRRNLTDCDAVFFKLYSQRLTGIFDRQLLNKAIRDNGSEDFLIFRKEEVLAEMPDTGRDFPGTLISPGFEAPIVYSFQPGEACDGLALQIRQDQLADLPLRRLPWLVPGLFEEKIQALIKNLPKKYRKQLAPSTERARIIAEEINFGEGDLFEEMGRFIRRKWQLSIPQSAWSEEGLPEHLVFHFDLLDSRGRQLSSHSRMEDLLKQQGGREAPSSSSWIKKYTIKNITKWPEQEFSKPKKDPRSGQILYPALVPLKNSIDLRFYLDEQEAGKQNPIGCARLLEMKFQEQLDFIKAQLLKDPDFIKLGIGFGGKEGLAEIIIKLIKKEEFQIDIRSNNQLEEIRQNLKPRLYPKAEEIKNQLKALLECWYDFRKQIAGIREKRPGSLELLSRIEKEGAAKIKREKLEELEIRQLPALQRQLEAALLRAERAALDPQKDREKQFVLKPVLLEQEKLARETRDILISREKQAAIRELDHQIEEYKISIFAPEKKGPGKVSEKRILKQIKEIREMI